MCILYVGIVSVFNVCVSMFSPFPSFLLSLPCVHLGAVSSSYPSPLLHSPLSPVAVHSLEPSSHPPPLPPPPPPLLSFFLLSFLSLSLSLSTSQAIVVRYTDDREESTHSVSVLLAVKGHRVLPFFLSHTAHMMSCLVMYVYVYMPCTVCVCVCVCVYVCVCVCACMCSCMVLSFISFELFSTFSP